METHLIKINSLTDYHLEDFIRCPKSFYHKHLLKKDLSPTHWSSLAQHTIDQTVKEFYTMPSFTRSTLSVLQSIDRHWIKKVERYHSREHYFDVLGSMTTCMMDCLMKFRNSEALFLGEKFKIFIPDWDIHLSMTFPFTIWEGRSFSVKRFVTDKNIHSLNTWINLTIFFCDRAFNVLPETIEIYGVLTGDVQVIKPCQLSLEKATKHLLMLKKTIQDPSTYDLSNDIRSL